ncbi:aminotransferase class I/II-fold pyridoxal phosphate-dependent enzyme [Pseudonocardiaceae bacterium YIM PH 21723]|nr:aminotransferase class I/II-fold pyridoxal phosphate-dependent enzyme [Pseudonocardiaceae bacterium YIM PH 21723]
MDSMIDLRSDTVTKPDDVMRAAMAAAEVGDDVLDHDPTMRALEERVAGLLGIEAALWVPSGCMGNLIALTQHLGRGDRFLAVKHAHVVDSELGTGSWIAGGAPVPLEPDEQGMLRPEDVRNTDGRYDMQRTTLLCIENTANFLGGTVTTPERHRELVATAHEQGLKVHLDGARLWNSAISQGVPLSVLAEGVDTVQVCLSKGLGAPVGSLVGGSAAFVAEARRMRKMLGGGVRQGGVLAAAGMVALDRMEELAEDHANARILADGLVDLGWEVIRPATNIVMATPPAYITPVELASVGVAAFALIGKIRFVTHRDVSKTDVTQALAKIATLHEGR